MTNPETIHNTQTMISLFFCCVPGFFKIKVMSDVGIKTKSITELHFPSNQFPQTPCPHTLCVPNSLVNEELDLQALVYNPQGSLPGSPLSSKGQAPQFECMGEPRVVTDTEGKASPSGKGLRSTT